MSELKQVWRVNVIASYKPWRDSFEHFVNEAAFNYLKEQNEGMYHEIELPGIEDDEQPEEDHYEAVDEYFETNKVEAEYPYILMGELTFYTE